MLSDKEGPHMGYTEPVMVEGIAAHPGGRVCYKKSKHHPSGQEKLCNSKVHFNRILLYYRNSTWIPLLQCTRETTGLIVRNKDTMLREVSQKVCLTSLVIQDEF